MQAVSVTFFINDNQSDAVKYNYVKSKMELSLGLFSFSPHNHVPLFQDTLKDFLERRERGELLIQKTSSLRSTITQPVCVYDMGHMACQQNLMFRP